MKHLFLTFTIFALSLGTAMAGGGVTQPLLQEGKVWKYDYSYVDINFNRQNGSAEWRVEGEIIIDGRRLYRMHFSNSEGSTFQQLWCEEYEKVYYCNEKGEPKGMVYDFTLSPGDKAPDHTNSELFIDGLTVASSDSILVHGTLRKRIVIALTDGESVTWVEGIGSPLCLDEPICHIVSDGRSYRLVSCSVGEEQVFVKEDFQAPSYKASTDGIKVQNATNDASSNSGTIHNLGGQSVLHPLPGHIYIKDGKKFVAQ